MKSLIINSTTKKRDQIIVKLVLIARNLGLGKSSHQVSNQQCFEFLNFRLKSNIYGKI